MKVNKSIAARMAAAAGTMLLASALSPATALADETVSGADILVPKVGEFIPALVGFLIVLAVLSKFAWPSILKTLEGRERKIAGDIDAAQQERAKADERLEVYEAKLAGAQREADAIIDEAKQTARQTQERIIEEANKQAADIVERGRASTESERRAAMLELTNSIADLSVGAASKIIGNSLDTTEQRQLVEKYLDEVGDLNAR